MEDKNKMPHPTATSTSIVADEEAQAQPMSLGRKILYHLWVNDQHLKSPEERKLVRKLDFGILICATLGWVSDEVVVIH